MPTPEEISNRKLGFSYWYVTHLKVLRRMLVFVCLAAAIILCVPSAIRITLMAIETPAAYSRAAELADGGIDWSKVHEKFKPKDVTVSRTEIISVGNGLYDVLVWVKNPNPNWYAHVLPYSIIFSGQRSQENVTFILPGEEKVIFSQNFRGPLTPTGAEQASVQLGQVEWQQIDKADEYTRPVFDVADVSVQNLTDQVNKTRVSAQITNRSIAGFASVTATVVLWSGQKPLAVGQTNLQNVLINDQRPIDVRFSNLITNVGETTIYFSADNLDKQNLIIR